MMATLLQHCLAIECCNNFLTTIGETTLFTIAEMVVLLMHIFSCSNQLDRPLFLQYKTMTNVMTVNDNVVTTFQQAGTTLLTTVNTYVIDAINVCSLPQPVPNKCEQTLLLYQYRTMLFKTMANNNLSLTMLFSHDIQLHCQYSIVEPQCCINLWVFMPLYERYRPGSTFWRLQISLFVLMTI